MTVRTLIASLALATALVGCATVPGDGNEDAGEEMLTGFGGDVPRGPDGAKIDPMSLDELRACAELKLETYEQQDWLVAESELIEAEGTRIDAVSEQIEAARSEVDTTSFDSVARFNERIDERHEQLLVHSDRIDAYNEQVNVYRGLNNRFQQECSGRFFRRDDLDNMVPHLAEIAMRDSRDFNAPVVRRENGKIRIGQ